MILEHQKRIADNDENRDALKKQWNNRHFMSSQNNNNNSLGGGGGRRVQQNQNMMMQNQQEYEAKERALLDELAELSKPLDDTIKIAIVDYMNLVFGAG